MADKWVFLIVIMLTTPIAYANSFDQSFQEGLNTATLHQKEAKKLLSQFNPKSVFNHYTPTPQQSDYYTSSTQNDAQLKQDAIETYKKDTAAMSIQSSFENRPTFTIDHNAPEMKKSDLIQNNSADIVNGISNQFVDCTKKQTCTTTYRKEICEETPASLNQFCKKELKIDVIPHQEDTHYSLHAHLSVDEHKYAGVSVNATNGQIKFLGPHDASFVLEGRIPANINCGSLQGKITHQSGAHLDYVNFPNCNNGLFLDFHMSGGHVIDLQIELVSSKTIYEPKDRWVDGCASLANNSACVFQSDTCIEPKSTHTIQGIPVTRDCWKKEDNYLCRMGFKHFSNSCQTYRDQGCEQIGSICENKTDGGCALFQQTFQCPVKQCSDVGVVCNGETYCITDDCMKHDKKADPDFQKSISALSAVNAASKEFDQHFVFSGNSKSCSEAPIGFLNCCADDGWGKDVHLANCSDDEKALGKAKENGLAIYVGEYCKKDVMGVCTSYRKSYCVFSSKLARIVQNQGRNQQLHIGFGDKKSPDCRGLAPDELQTLDFSRMDFSEFYSDIAKKEHLADQEETEKRIQERIQAMTQGGKPHG